MKGGKAPTSPEGRGGYGVQSQVEILSPWRGNFRGAVSGASVQSDPKPLTTIPRQREDCQWRLFHLKGGRRISTEVILYLSTLP